MTVIKVETESTLPPQRVVQAAYDFSDRPQSIFAAVSVKRMNIHAQRQTDADAKPLGDHSAAN